VQKQGPISLQIEDELGRTVSTIASGMYGSGRHALDFNATALPNGTYYAVLQTASGAQTTKLIVTR
jgi:flagellar hook assembly protein FlgD